MDGSRTRPGRRAAGAAAAVLFWVGLLAYAWLQRSLLPGIAELFR
ncbi:MAG: hypothetical protein WC943_16410 [Elusimicrobiota bacterium]